MKPTLTCSAALSAALALASAVSAQTFTDQGATLLPGERLDARSGSFADIDNDGDLDLLTQGGSGARQLFRNLTVETGTPAFENITASHGPVANDTTGWSAGWADYDSDGDVDVFLGQTNRNGASGDLFRNDGAAGFTNVSGSTVNDPGFHQNVGWMDADLDGDLDLMLAMEGPEEHELYLQQPDGSFVQSGAQAGLQVPFGTKAYGTAIGDYDDDGDYDLYVSTCIGSGSIRNNFFQNRFVEDGTVTFVDIADSNGTQFLPNSYGSEFVDFDDDGDLDLWMAGADQEETKIWRNDGNEIWTDVSTILGHPVLPTSGGDFNGGKAVDYDNDGDLDLFLHDHKFNNNVSNARSLFRNDGNWVFTDVTAQEGLEDANMGAYDSPWGDFDLDGDMDLYAATDGRFDERFFVSNASTNGNQWLHVRLLSDAPNTRAIGAKVFATIHEDSPEERTLRRENNTNIGTFNQSDLPVHLGLGSADVVNELVIHWPDGEIETFTDLAANRHITIRQGAGPDLWLMN